jgi:hypothetical protein
MKIKFYFFLLILPLFLSCDILRFSKFEVISWTPGEGYYSESEKIIVSLEFSREPDIAIVERNFSLTGNENRIKGNFLWDGRKVAFTPLTPLEKNTDYVLSLSADACDTKGLSMDEAFNREFTTRPENSRPVLLSCYPQMYAEIGDPRTEVRLYFSIPVPLITLYDNVSFNPSMTGSWRLEEGGKLAVFTPAEPWTQLKQYEIHISTSLTDNNGMNIGNDFTSIFTTGTDHEKPYLLSACRITKDGYVFKLTPDKGHIGAAQLPVENHEWEKEDRFSLVFSKPVDGLSVKNYLITENAPSLVMETSPDYRTEFIFKFENIPAYESRFTFRIKPGIKDIAGNESKDEYIYRIFANGKYSKPPMLVGIRMPMSPNNAMEPEYFSAGTDSLFMKIPIKDENYPSGESVKTWIELYFITAEGASIDPFSIMELFRIETSNNVITFSPRQVKHTNFSDPQAHTDWENFERLEIAGNIVNSTNFGLINFIVGAGLKDSFGNKNEKTQKISVVK